MSAKQSGSITGWGNRIGNHRTGFWGLTAPLQTFQRIIRELVQHLTMPPCPLRIQRRCSWVCPQKMKNVTADMGVICKCHAGNSKSRTLPASSRELATWGKESWVEQRLPRSLPGSHSFRTNRMQHNCTCKYNSQRPRQSLEAIRTPVMLGFSSFQSKSYSLDRTRTTKRQLMLWMIRASTCLPVNYFLNQGHLPSCTQSTILVPNPVTCF